MAVKKRSESKMVVSEDVAMDVWRDQAGQTRKNQRRSEGGGGVEEDAKLRRHGRVIRRDGESDERRILEMKVKGRRRRGRLKTS